MVGKRIVWEMPDGSIRVGKCLIVDEARFVAKAERAPEMIGARRLADPTDGEKLDKRWRECWRNRGDGHIHADMTLARKQRLYEIRDERTRRLAETDWQPLRAYEQGLDGPMFAQTHEGIRRKKLRDITRTIDLDSITTPEELAEFEPEWPEIKR